jgi:hypothetical protein
MFLARELLNVSGAGISHESSGIKNGLPIAGSLKTVDEKWIVH